MMEFRGKNQITTPFTQMVLAAPRRLEFLSGFAFTCHLQKPIQPAHW